MQNGLLFRSRIGAVGGEFAQNIVTLDPQNRTGRLNLVRNLVAFDPQIVPDSSRSRPRPGGCQGGTQSPPLVIDYLAPTPALPRLFWWPRVPPVVIDNLAPTPALPRLSWWPRAPPVGGWVGWLVA